MMNIVLFLRHGQELAKASQTHTALMSEIHAASAYWRRNLTSRHNVMGEDAKKRLVQSISNIGANTRGICTVYMITILM